MSHVQEMGYRDTSFGPALYIKVFRDDGKPMSWTEVWETYSALHPAQWAVQFFPPVAELVDQANIYHLYVLDEPPRGVNIRYPRSLTV